MMFVTWQQVTPDPMQKVLSTIHKEITLHLKVFTGPSLLQGNNNLLINKYDVVGLVYQALS
jgi:hypothetical protein